jgi:hypothetical protein
MYYSLRRIGFIYRESHRLPGNRLGEPLSSVYMKKAPKEL